MSLALGAACTGSRSLFELDDGLGGGRSGGPNPLVGEWEATLLILVETDVQLWTTQWTFRQDATCRFRQSVRSTLDDTVIVKLRDCRWSTANGRLRITFTDTGATVESDYFFPGGDISRLLFENLEYRRVSG